MESPSGLTFQQILHFSEVAADLDVEVLGTGETEIKKLDTYLDKLESNIIHKKIWLEKAEKISIPFYDIHNRKRRAEIVSKLKAKIIELKYLIKEVKDQIHLLEHREVEIKTENRIRSNTDKNLH